MGWFGKKKTPEEKQIATFEIAIAANTPDAVVALVQKGANPDVQIGDDDTPLVYLLRRWHQEQARALVKAGADPNFKAKNGMSPLESAFGSGWSYGIRYIIEDGANLNERFTNGNYAIHAAAGSSTTEALAVVLKHGVKDIDALNNDGQTALHIAAKAGMFSNAIMLIENGADPGIKDLAGKTPADLVLDHKTFKAILSGLPASPLQREDRGEWRLVNPDEVARVTHKHSIGYRITEIFNFRAHTYVHIARNLETGAESQSVKAFSALDDVGEIEAAQSALARLGGRAFGFSTDKKKLAAPGAA